MQPGGAKNRVILTLKQTGFDSYQGQRNFSLSRVVLLFLNTRDNAVLAFQDVICSSKKLIFCSTICVMSIVLQDTHLMRLKK